MIFYGRKTDTFESLLHKEILTFEGHKCIQKMQDVVSVNKKAVD